MQEKINALNLVFLTALKEREWLTIWLQFDKF